MDLVAACVELAAFWTWSLHVLSSLRSGHTLSTTHREHKTPRAQDTASTRHREHKTPRAQDTASTRHREHNTPRAQHTASTTHISTTTLKHNTPPAGSTTHLEHDTPRARHTSSTTHLEHDPPRARPTSSTTHLEHDPPRARHPPQGSECGCPQPTQPQRPPPPTGGGGVHSAARVHGGSRSELPELPGSHQAAEIDRRGRLGGTVAAYCVQEGRCDVHGHERRVAALLHLEATYAVVDGRI